LVRWNARLLKKASNQAILGERAQLLSMTGKEDIMPAKPKIPKTSNAKRLDEDALVDISLTRTQFRNLLKAVYLGEYVANGYRVEDRIQEFEDIEQTLLVLAERLGFRDLVEYDEGLKKYFPTNEFDEAMMIYLDDFEEESFWEELSSRLAVRDMFREFGEKGVKRMSRMTYATEQLKRQGRYAREMEDHGIDRLEITQEKKA
jgi:hypothetical protein